MATKWDVFKTAEFEHIYDVEAQRVREMVASGDLGPNDCVRPTGTKHWKRLGEIDRSELVGKDSTAAGTGAVGDQPSETAADDVTESMREGSGQTERPKSVYEVLFPDPDQQPPGPQRGGRQRPSGFEPRESTAKRLLPPDKAPTDPQNFPSVRKDKRAADRGSDSKSSENDAGSDDEEDDQQEIEQELDAERELDVKAIVDQDDNVDQDDDFEDEDAVDPAKPARALDATGWFAPSEEEEEASPPTTANVARQQPAKDVPATENELESPIPANERMETSAGYDSEETEEDDGFAEVFLTSRRRRRFEDLDLTAMVDVTFLLVMFFMLTATYTLQQSMEVPAPKSDEKTAQQARTLDDLREDFIIVTISGDNVIMVDGEETSEDRLVAVIRQTLRQSGKTQLILHGDGAAHNGKVVKAIDAAQEVGIQTIRLAAVRGAAAPSEFLP